jgi:hypothetical protein
MFKTCNDLVSKLLLVFTRVNRMVDFRYILPNQCKHTSIARIFIYCNLTDKEKSCNYKVKLREI